MILTSNHKTGFEIKFLTSCISKLLNSLSSESLYKNSSKTLSHEILLLPTHKCFSWDKEDLTVVDIKRDWLEI